MVEYFVGCEDPPRVNELDLAMVSAYSIRNRKKPLDINRWMLDSGAFSQVVNYGDFLQDPKEYVRLCVRFQECGDLACVVSQDYMCEPQVIDKLKRIWGKEASVRCHQRKTIDRYVQIKEEAQKQGLKVPIMPVLQGWEVEDYVQHFKMYEEADLFDMPTVVYHPDPYGGYFPSRRYWGQWLGIGSTCKRNQSPEVVSTILDLLYDYWDEQCIKAEGFRIHLFGYKQTGLKQSSIRDRIWSADSMAPDYAHRVECREKGIPRTRRSRMDNMLKFQDKMKHQSVQTCLTL
jgi:hypothetical protein